VLAPPADDPVQFIDARDLGEWTIRMCESKTYGVFNAVGPAKPFTSKRCSTASRAPSSRTQVLRTSPPSSLRRRIAGARLVRPAGLDSALRAYGGFYPAQHCEGAGQRPYAPGLPGYRAGHARVLPRANTGAARSLEVRHKAEREAAVLAAWKARTSVAK